MEQQEIKDKSTEVLMSFFGLDDNQLETVVTLDRFAVELISDALAQAFTKGK